jgi:hypothetical protein
MMEAARSSETVVNFHQTTWRYNPEDSHLRINHRENLKSYIIILYLHHKEKVYQEAIDAVMLIIKLSNAECYFGVHKFVIQYCMELRELCRKIYAHLKARLYLQIPSNHLFTMRSEVVSAVKVGIVVFWIIVSCSLVNGYQHFGGTYNLCLHALP